MISFYHIRGISLTDTPFFETLEQQQLFFQEYKVFDYGDAYMPPHFTNELVVYSEELDYENGMDFNTQINYLSLEFNNKTYYYFISDVRYEGEGSMRLYLTMDTIQTYMFNIKYTNARIDRRTIKRWNQDGTINRNYIRENFGNELFNNVDYKDFTKEEKILGFCGWIVIKVPKEKWLGIQSVQSVAYYKKPENENDIFSGGYCRYQDGSYIGIIPALTFERLTDTQYNQSVKYYIGDTLKFNGAIKDLVQLLHRNQEDPNVIQMYYLPWNPFVDIFVKGINDETQVLIDEDAEHTDLNIELSGELETFGMIQINMADITPIGEKATLPYNIKNNTLGIPFTRFQLPQLLDENYIQCFYGERGSLTQAPLSRFNLPNITIWKSCDIFCGARNYWITQELYQEDIYLTRKIVDTDTRVLMLNDYWKQYVAGNKGSLAINTTLGALNAVFPFGKTFTNTIKGTAGDIDIGQALYMGAYNSNQIGMNYGVGSYQGKFTPYNLGTADTVNSFTARSEQFKKGDLLSMAENAINLMAKPETMTQPNYYTDDVFNENTNVVYIRNEVSNIDMVATIYETIGYKVNTFVQGSPIFNDRQIYNYVKCGSIDFDLDILTTLDIKNNVAERYISGIRYWNTNNMKLLSLELGEVCKYDNIETE